MQARERQLHLGLDAVGARDGQVERGFDEVLEQRRLPDPGLTTQYQRPTLAAADVIDQIGQLCALVGAPEEAHVRQASQMSVVRRPGSRPGSTRG